MKSKVISKDLKLYFIYSIMSSFILTRGIFLLFLLSKGLNMIQIVLYQSIFNITTLIFEIPTGYFGDKFGKKKSIFLGMMLLTLHALLMVVFSNSFLLIALGVVEAIAYAFISGSNQALLYELLEDNGNNKQYLKINSIRMALESLCTGGALLLGAIIAEQSWNIVYIATAIIFLVSGLVLIAIKKQKRGSISEKTEKISFRNLAGNIIYSFPIIFFIFFIGSSICDGFFMSFYNFNQLILGKFGVSIALIGVLFSASYFLNSAAYLSVNLLTKVFNKKQILIGCLIMECLLFLTISSQHNIPLILVLTLSILFFPEVMYTISDSIIQQNIKSGYRATILSIVSMLRGGSSALIYLFFGNLFNLLDFRFAMIILAIIIGIIFISSFCIYIRTKSMMTNITCKGLANEEDID